MPGWRRSLSVACAGLALLPAAASAQSAGDEQYEDPFGDEQPQAAPTATPAPAAQPAQATPAPAPAAPAPSPAATELPRTGGDARLPALLGAVLLASGV